MTAAHDCLLTVILMNFQVSVIQSCSQSMNKVVESLQQKFPTVSKLQLRNKVREISDFVDNRWQVSGFLELYPSHVTDEDLHVKEIFESDH